MGLIGPKGESMSSDFQHIRQKADSYDDCNDKSISLKGIETIAILMERRNNNAPKRYQRVLSSPENPFSCCDTISAISIAKFVG
jgi:hypothetical protein